MDDIYVYFTTLPPGIREMVTPCADGYTIYIEERLSRQERIEAYAHAVRHIQNDDWHRDCSVERIESDAHK